MTSSGSAVSANAVKPRKSQNTTTMSRRWVSRMFSSPLRDNQFGELRRQKPFQLADPFEFAELRGDAVLQFAVPRRDLVGAGAQFAEQPRILHRDHCLRREILQQRDLLVGKRPNLLAVDAIAPSKVVVLAQRQGIWLRTPPRSISSRIWEGAINLVSRAYRLKCTMRSPRSIAQSSMIMRANSRVALRHSI